jgi:arylsulfatase
VEAGSTEAGIVRPQHFTVTADSALPAGEHQVRMEFKYDGGGIGKGGTAGLFVDGKKVGSGRVDRTHPINVSLDETTDVGRDSGSPVTSDYPARDNAFSGTLKWVRLDVGSDDHSHLIDPRQRVHLAMSRQ